MPLKFSARIGKGGKIVTEILDAIAKERGQHLCSEVYKVTNAVGRQLSDDTIGPECETVSEVLARRPTGVGQPIVPRLIETQLAQLAANEATIAKLREDNALMRAEHREGERLLARARKRRRK